MKRIIILIIGCFVLFGCEDRGKKAKDALIESMFKNCNGTLTTSISSGTFSDSLIITCTETKEERKVK